MSATSHAPATSLPHDNSVIETLQSLIVAFVLAMTFRGFVTEGFVIPTGSMAPTLLGQHKALHSDQTGWDFSAGTDTRDRDGSIDGVPDPMLGPAYPGSGTSRGHARTRMGDRILVLKTLYQFSRPSRFDVVVFKNPTNPNGEDGNYIKRLIGLPDESIWLADGDVFSGSALTPDDYDSYQIQRKPEYVQRAVWQPVHHSDYFPVRPETLDATYRGSPWTGEGWLTDQRADYRCDTAEPTVLEWDNHVRVIDDWASYNTIVQRMTQREAVAVGDLRVAAAVVPDEPGLEMTFELVVRGHQMEFRLADGMAHLRMRAADYGNEFPEEGWEGPAPVEIGDLPAGRPTRVEFWHVDQKLYTFVDGKRVTSYEYDWGPVERLQFVTNQIDDPAVIAHLTPARPPELRLRFDGSPLTVHRLRVDRDLYYRADRLNDNTRRNPTNPGFERVVRRGQYAFGTHPDNLAVLGPDHFFMAGDNSPASSDSRLWGNPHPLVATQIDAAPFVVNRRLLLGKAWVVYFPAPHSVTDHGRAFIPDFGKLRFIR